jgi:hypothetical protein
MADKDQTRYGDDVGGDYGQNQAQAWARRMPLKDRQSIGTDPDSYDHTVTHRPPDYSGASNMSIQPGKARNDD